MPTSRVLPWRRGIAAPAVETRAASFATFHARHPKAPTARIVRAYEIAAQAHEGQQRPLGRARMSSIPWRSAEIVAKFGLDDTTICAALLHDAVEDTAVTLEEIERDFGVDVAQIVDGVTKLSGSTSTHKSSNKPPRCAR
jgi:GTP pyrophosphokinase